MRITLGARNTLLAIGLVLAALTTFALAHEGATGVVKERMDLMKGQAKQMKLIGDMAKGKKRFDATKAATAARDIGLSTKKIPDLFPKGTSGHPSEALDAIWTEWDRFSGDAKDAETAAGALADTLERNGAEGWKDAFKKLTEACKSCHESFRAEEEEHGDH